MGCARFGTQTPVLLQRLSRRHRPRPCAAASICGLPISPFGPILLRSLNAGAGHCMAAPQIHPRHTLSIATPRLQSSVFHPLLLRSDPCRLTVVRRASCVDALIWQRGQLPQSRLCCCAVQRSLSLPLSNLREARCRHLSGSGERGTCGCAGMCSPGCCGAWRAGSAADEAAAALERGCTLRCALLCLPPSGPQHG